SDVCSSDLGRLGRRDARCPLATGVGCGGRQRRRKPLPATAAADGWQRCDHSSSGDAMIRARRRSGAPELGQDAFLDIVANLVGILIILVVILGSRSQEVADAVRQQAETAAPAAAAPPPTADELHAKLLEMERETGRAAAALADSQRLEAAIRQSDLQLALVSQQRGELLD